MKRTASCMEQNCARDQTVNVQCLCRAGESNVIAVFWALAVSLCLHAGAAGQIASLDSEIARGSGAQPCGG